MLSIIGFICIFLILLCASIWIGFVVSATHAFGGSFGKSGVIFILGFVGLLAYLWYKLFTSVEFTMTLT